MKFANENHIVIGLFCPWWIPLTKFDGINVVPNWPRRIKKSWSWDSIYPYRSGTQNFKKMYDHRVLKPNKKSQNNDFEILTFLRFYWSWSPKDTLRNTGIQKSFQQVTLIQLNFFNGINGPKNYPFNGVLY